MEEDQENKEQESEENNETSKKHDKHDVNEEDSEVISKLKENPWMIVSGVLILIIAALLIWNLTGGLTGNVISEDKAGANLVDYLNSMTGGGVELISVSDAGSLYEVIVSYNGQEIPVYSTKDGKYFVQNVVPITGDAVNSLNTSQPPAPQDIPKSDKPEVELFIMTECPYGTQAEKGLIPTIEALGDKADIQIRFVHYFMHGDVEEQETYRQVCIREEQSDKYLDYLSCYLGAGDSATCLTETQINKAKLTSCIATKSEDYYAQDSELSNQYGVQGSPTLVINGVQANSGRDSVSYLDTICSAFSTQPAECETQLSSASPSPGFGYAASASGATDATC